MSYYQTLKQLTDSITDNVRHLEMLQKYRERYLNSASGNHILIANVAVKMFIDGKPNPAIDSIRMAFIETYDEHILAVKDQIEKMRSQIKMMDGEVGNGNP